MMVEGPINGAPKIGASERAQRAAPDIAFARAAETALADAAPLWSARPVAGSHSLQRSFAMMGLAVLIAPELVALALGWAGIVVFAALLMFRVGVLAFARPALTVHALEAETPLPVYTVLIALKDEAASMPQLAAALRALDYPADRLDVKLLIESGDDATQAAIARETWPLNTELHIVPPGAPRTKPRALNYGLKFARGTFVVVYDAEDVPHPQQLKAALAAFAGGPPQLACVQAPLVGGAENSAWISAHWALEYAIQFGLILPGLARLQAPIMLGGTSNHFRRRALEDAGGWDAWNVTEDADLGLRFARLGLPVGMIAPPTLEAPPEKFGVWLAQRSRWLKGFLQTWGVLMRDPAGLWRDLGAAKFIALHLSLSGAIASALVHGFWALWCVYCWLSPDAALGFFGLTFTALAYCVNAAIAWTAPSPKKWRRAGLILTLPLYWPLQTLAMMRALYGLFRAPQFWAKTPHH